MSLWDVSELKALLFKPGVQSPRSRDRSIPPIFFKLIFHLYTSAAAYVIPYVHIQIHNYMCWIFNNNNLEAVRGTKLKLIHRYLGNIIDPQLLDKDDINRHAKVDKKKTMRTQLYPKNYRKLKNAQTEQNSPLQGWTQQWLCKTKWKHIFRRVYVCVSTCVCM